MTEVSQVLIAWERGDHRGEYDDSAQNGAQFARYSIANPEEETKP